MKFVKTEDLKKGMRIARPIYNKKGVLLYERDSKLTDASITSIRNFGLIGIFILEPAEPAPPMSEEDLEFERFQTIQVYALEAELSEIINSKRTKKLDTIAASVNKHYGHLNHKINFPQNLRSKDDFVYKHSLNVAILSALMCHRMQVQVDDTNDCIVASLVHDIGKLMVPDSVLKGATDEEAAVLYDRGMIQGYEFIGDVFSANPNVKRICLQTNKALEDLKNGTTEDSKVKVVVGARVLIVAETYDSMTAMNFEGEPASEIEALRYLTSNPRVFHPRAVEALVDSINILGQGTCVELSNGDKALVLAVNPLDILKPMVLCFGSNKVMDLSSTLYDDIRIVDIMKTMDERYVLNNDEMKSYIGPAGK